jgi:hypothetical protein
MDEDGGMLKKVKLRGMDKVGWLFTFTGAAYNLCRLRNLMARACPATAKQAN